MLYEIKKKSDLDSFYIPLKKQMKSGFDLREFLLDSYLSSNPAKFFVTNFHIKEVGKNLFVEMTYKGIKFNPYEDLPHPNPNIKKGDTIGGTGGRFFWWMVEEGLLCDFKYSYHKGINKFSFLWDRQGDMEIEDKDICLSDTPADFKLRLQLNSHGGGNEFGAYYFNRLNRSSIKSTCTFCDDTTVFAPHQSFICELMYNVIYYSKIYKPVYYRVIGDYVICYPNIPISPTRQKNMFKYHECKFITNKIIYKWRY